MSKLKTIFCLNSSLLLGSALFMCLFAATFCAVKVPGAELIERVADIKDFKRLLRTKTNVLAFFVEGETKAQVKEMLTIASAVAGKIYGKGTILFVDCLHEEGKKLCKKMKVNHKFKPFDIKHYHNGDYHVDYQRSHTVDSMTNFMLDPTGDIPWEEEQLAQDVVHIHSGDGFLKLVKKAKHPILAMFYAPWCGHCKKMKPDYAMAATELKNKNILAAIDATKPDNAPLAQHLNVSGYPTLLYFEPGGNFKFPFNGERTRQGIISWLKDPKEEAGKPAGQEETPWADEPSDVVHLTDSTFHAFIAQNPSVLVMFYAPWCGHCKQMKPGYTTAAKKLKAKNVDGVLAAVDATKETALGKEFEIKGFPTLKYFADGKFAWDVNERLEDKIISFMEKPTEPPPPPPPEVPWEETAGDVIHLNSENFKSELKKRKHAIVMFYAPWCGHCKAAKPEFVAAAAKHTDDAKIGFFAVDCTKYTAICEQNEVTGFPTILYFSYLKAKVPYNGGRTEQAFLSFLAQQVSGGYVPPITEKKAEAPSEVVLDPAVRRLDAKTFQQTLKGEQKTLVMFYAPWCGFSKLASPEFSAAAKEKRSGFAAIDCGENGDFCQQQKVDGYPTFKIYKNGNYEKDFTDDRTKISFLKIFSTPTKEEL